MIILTIYKQRAYLFPEVGPLQRDHAHIHGVRDERLVVHELIRREGGYCVQEQLCCLLEVPDGDAVEPLVHFQPIPSVPVTPFFDEARGKGWAD